MPEVLVIDDDPFIRELLRLHLRNAGCAVRCAADPTTGIQAVIDAPPDLILLDVNMPYMSGLDVLRAIKADPHSLHIPVIMLTSRTDDETWAAANKAGANAYLTKPVDGKELMRTLARWLKGFKQ